MSSPQINIEPINLVHKVVQPIAASDARAPTLVLLHGRGTDENDLLALASRFDSRLLLVSLRAPYPFPFGGFTWYSTTPSGAPDPATLQKSLTRVSRFLQLLPRLYAADPLRTYVMGFSMGAAIALALGMLYPGRFAGIIAHSGFIPDGAQGTPEVVSANSTRFYLAHGEKDQVVPLRSGLRAAEQLRGTGVPLEWHQYPITHEISQESVSGAAQWLSARLDGAAPSAPPR